MSEGETTLKVNVSYVGDLRSALAKADHSARIEVRTLIVGSGLTIDEVTVADDGHLVLYVGLNASAN